MLGWVLGWVLGWGGVARGVDASGGEGHLYGVPIYIPSRARGMSCVPLLCTQYWECGGKHVFLGFSIVRLISAPPKRA